MAHGAQMPRYHRALRVDTGCALHFGSPWTSRRNTDHDGLHIPRENEDPLRDRYVSRLPETPQRIG